MKNRKPWETVTRTPLGKQLTASSGTLKLTGIKIDRYDGVSPEPNESIKEFRFAIDGKFRDNRGLLEDRQFSITVGLDEGLAMSEAMMSLNAYFGDYRRGLAIDTEVRQRVGPDIVVGFVVVETEKALDFLEFNSGGPVRLVFHDETTFNDLADKLRAFYFRAKPS